MTTNPTFRQVRIGGLVLVAAATLGGAGASVLAAGNTAGVLPPIEHNPTAADIGTTDEWIVDLGALDALVRARYADPFTNVSEAQWEAAMAELASRLPSASAAEAASEVSGLVAELVGATTVELPNSAIVVYLPEAINATVDVEVPARVPCPAPRPAACPQ